MTNPITQESIEQFVAAWYHALDIHAPIQECRRMLADKELNMHFPDGDIRDFGSFQKWYERVINLFFDERHTIQKIEVRSATDDQVDLSVVVRWQASWWNPSAAQSHRVDLESNQTWTVRRCSVTEKPYGLEIVTYLLADEFVFAPSSAELPKTSPNNAAELIRLNERSVKLEQDGDTEESVKFFNTHLSNNLVFRRADDSVVGKFAPDGFLGTLKNKPFKKREVKDTSVRFEGGRAVVTLIVEGVKNDDSVHRYRNIRFFTHNGENWILESWYNYEIPGQ